MRLCVDADSSVTEVDEEHVHRVSPRPALPAPPAFPHCERVPRLTAPNTSPRCPGREGGTVGKFTVELTALLEPSC